MKNKLTDMRTQTDQVVIPIMAELVPHLVERDNEWWVTGLIGDEIHVYCSVFGHRGIVANPTDEEKRRASAVDLRRPGCAKLTDAGHRWTDAERISLVSTAPGNAKLGPLARAQCGMLVRSLGLLDQSDQALALAAEVPIKNCLGELALKLDFLEYVPWFEAQRAGQRSLKQD